MNFIKKLWEYMAKHPIIAFIATFFTFAIIEAAWATFTNQQSIHGFSLYYCLILWLFISGPLGRKRRSIKRAKQKEKDIYELAHKIAEENYKYNHKEEDRNWTQTEQQAEHIEDYSHSYQKKYLFTKNEWYAHKRLVELAKEKNLVICPKVRLLDIIEPRSGEKNYMSLMGKIQSKHVDFVICNSGMKVLGVVELDDNSHKLKDRQDRDEFVNEILTSVGYKVVHTYGIQDNTLDCFIEKNIERPLAESAEDHQEVN